MSLDLDHRHFSSIALELGFVSEAQVAEALALRDELRENGVTAHVSDLLIDAGAITVQQCEQVDLQQDMLLVLSGIGKARVAQAEGAWVVAGIAPVVAFASFYGVLACAVAVAVGAFVARSFAIRWVALGWVTSVVVPGVPLSTVAASGTVADQRKRQLYAAATIAASSALLLFDIAITPGLVFLIAGFALALARLRT